MRSTLRNSKLAPLDVTDKDWLIQSKLSYEESLELKHMGRWALPYSRRILNEQWKNIHKLYKNDELPNCKYIMCSTGKDTKEKNGVILFYFENSKQEDKIKEYGNILLELLKYKPPNGVNGIYYKSKTVGADKKHLYKIDSNVDDSDSD